MQSKSPCYEKKLLQSNRGPAQTSRQAGGVRSRATNLNKRDYENTFSNEHSSNHRNGPRGFEPSGFAPGRVGDLVPKRIFESQKKCALAGNSNYRPPLGNHRRAGRCSNRVPGKLKFEFLGKGACGGGSSWERGSGQQMKEGTTRLSPEFDETFSKIYPPHWDSNRETRFPGPAACSPPTRNDVYTRSYKYDESSCLFQKTVDLSKIYADCPRMYSMRRRYMFWVLQSVQAFGFVCEDQILSRTVQILDFLFCKCEMEDVHSRELTKIGVTCLWIAAKYEGVNLRLEDLVGKLDPDFKMGFRNAFQELLSTENTVLKGIDFRISSPAHFDFVENFIFRIFYTKRERKADRGQVDPLSRRRGADLTTSGFHSDSTTKMKENNDDRCSDPKLSKNKTSAKGKTPISFEAFKAIMGKHRKSQKKKQRISARDHWQKENRGVLVYRKLETLLRKMVLYYLKVMYTSMSSCKETHLGALACVKLAFKALEQLPVACFREVQPTMNDKYLFFMRSSRFRGEAHSPGFLSPDHRDPKPDSGRPSSPEPANGDKSCAQKSTQGKKTNSLLKCHNPKPKGIIFQIDGQEAFFNDNSEGHKSRADLPDPIPRETGARRRPTVDLRVAKRGESSSLGAQVDQVEAFWSEAMVGVKDLFMKSQCLRFLRYRICRILDKYFLDEIEEIELDVLKAEKARQAHADFAEFWKRERPFSGIL